MSIGSTIKRLRRKKDITQEQLAEYLGITSRAISQWECDRTAPDISQIPPLCHIFDVTSDELLGIDMARVNEAIQRCLDEARDEEHRGNFQGSADILREAHRRFPRSYTVMQRLANALVCVYSRGGIKNYDEPIALCNRVLAECTDSMTRYEAMDTLGIAYIYAGKTEEVRRLAKEMPPARFSYEDFMTYRWKGDADREEFQSYMAYLICHTLEMIGLAVGQRHDDGSFFYSLEDRIRLWKTEITLLETLFPDEDYHFNAQLGESACSFLCTAYLRKGEHEEAWYWLQRGADFAVHMDTYGFETPHTSPVLRGYVSGGWIMEANGNRTQALLDWLTSDEEAEAFRSDARFHELVSRLKKVAKKP